MIDCHINVIGCNLQPSSKRYWMDPNYISRHFGVMYDAPDVF